MTPSTPPLDFITKKLHDRFGELGDKAGAELKKWLSGPIPFAYPEMISLHLGEEYLDLIFDAFWQVLPFGTGGRRGKVGYGPNRLNPTTVAMTVQGHCQYLRKTFGDKSSELTVVVANDVRQFHDIGGVYRFLGKSHPLLGTSSRSLAKLACEIYAGNGMVAYLAEPHSPDAVLSTPELSFLINELKAVGGINLSASHNPPDDNGIKVYDEYGSQPIAPQDQRLVDEMAGATDIRSLPFEQALSGGLVRPIPKELHEKYINTYLALYRDIYRPRQDAPFVYTPLCGCGLSTAGEVLSRLGFPYQVPPEQFPDGTFAPIPFKAPNPEVPEATAPAKAFADQNGCGMVLSSDPDADRIGLEVKLADGSWYHCDGNQIAAILSYFLLADPEGPRRKGLVIETLVTTKIVGHIAKTAGSMLVDDLLVGFKYIADVLKSLEQTGRYRHITGSPDQLVIATEESHGVMMVPTIRDKDATPACIYLAALYQKLQAQGKTLFDYYTHILEEVGGFDTVNRSITMSGADGMLRKDKILSSLRQSPPTALGGHKVNKVVDYWDLERFGAFVSDTDRLPRNVIQYFTDTCVTTVRPSGTEPKLKFYCQLLSDGNRSGVRGTQLLKEARERADRIARTIYNELLNRVDLSLSEETLYLPDIIDLNQKHQFEHTTGPALREALSTGKFKDLSETLAWLRDRSARMTPGADPLPALKGAVATLCNRWAKEKLTAPLLDELRRWAA
jgi:phosphoglucomutase